MVLKASLQRCWRLSKGEAMRRNLIVLAIVCTMLVPVWGEANQQKGVVRELAACAESGRYQLFQGSYTTFDLKRKETYVSQAVFLLDSQTGEVKRYVNKVDEEGRYIETWLPTDVTVTDKRRQAQEGK